jgi:hypothetical protein
MIIHNPGPIRFGDLEWPDATLITIERIAARLIEDHDDCGPFPAFIDVPEQSIHIRVHRTPAADDLDDPPLGTAAALVVFAARPEDGRARRRITATCTLIGIRPECPTGNKPPTKTLLFRAHSTDGSDPIVLDEPSLSEA